MNDHESPIDPHLMALLLAQADGRLDATTAAQLERQLRDDPGAATALQYLKLTSPTNTTFWSLVAAPPPTDEQWNRVYQQLLHTTPRPSQLPGGKRPWLVAGIALGILAVGTFSAVFFLQRSERLQEPLEVPEAEVATPVPSSPLDGTDVLPMATYDDVMIRTFRSPPEHPWYLPERALDEPLILATTQDIHLTQPLQKDAQMPAPNGLPILIEPQR